MTDPDLTGWLRQQILDDRTRAAHVHDCECRSILTRLGTLRPHADCDCDRPRNEDARCVALLRMVDDLVSDTTDPERSNRATQWLRVLASGWQHRDGWDSEWMPQLWITAPW